MTITMDRPAAELLFEVAISASPVAAKSRYHGSLGWRRLWIRRTPTSALAVEHFPACSCDRPKVGSDGSACQCPEVLSLAH